MPVLSSRPPRRTEKAAKCPEPLCPTRVLPPLGRREPSPERTLLLRRRSYWLMRRSRGLSPPLAFGLVWRVLAGCNQSLLPTAACRVGRGVTTPTPHRTGRAELPLTGSSRESFAHGGVMSNAVRDSLVNCQFSYPLTFRVRGCEAQSPLPCPVSGPLLAAPPFP